MSSPVDIGVYNCFKWEFRGSTAKPSEFRAQCRIKYFTRRYSGILFLIRYLLKDILKSVTTLQYIPLKVCIKAASTGLSYTLYFPNKAIFDAVPNRKVHLAESVKTPWLYFYHATIYFAQ